MRWGLLKILVVLCLGLALCAFEVGTVWAVSNEDCLECHGDPDFSTELPNGKVRSLYVNPDRFKASVHGVNEVSCTDCHADLSELDYDKDVPHKVPAAPVSCGDCHDEEQSAYESSVHASFRKQGKKTAPYCFNCHDYHYTKHLEALTVEERADKFCLKCHDPMKIHAWLPEKKLHFKHVGCSVCHAPETGGEVALRLYDVAKGEFLSGEKLLKVLKVDYDNFAKHFDKDGDGKFSADELSQLVKVLRKNKIHAVVRGEFVVKYDPSLHAIVKDKAVKDCDACHSANSSFMQKVYLVVSKKDGTAAKYPVDNKALSSIYVPDFYAINANRVPWLDIIGVLIVLGGVAFAGGHGTLRLLTIPLRRKDK